MRQEEGIFPYYRVRCRMKKAEHAVA